MTRFLPKIYLDISSFWAGIILVVILVVLILIYRKRLTSFLSRTLTAFANFRESLSITSDSDYVQVLYKHAQGLHLLSDFFPLESILVPTKCIAPPPYLFPGNQSLDPSLNQEVIGFDPLLPQLNSEFFGPTFSLFDAVQSGTSICLVGFPGTGKTTAIAECIASLVKATQSEEPLEPRIPFYVTAHQLLAQFPGHDLLGIILKALQLNKSFLVVPNFPKYMTSAINDDRSILFIDDMDSLTLEEINQLANFITALRTQIPGLQIVATASPSCLGNLAQAPLEQISIAPWGSKEKYHFLTNLSQLWPSIQPAENQSKSADYAVTNSMLVVSGQNLTPFEFTLRAVSAYAGDLAGPASIHALDAYLQRLPALSQEDIKALALMALHCLDENTSSFTRKGFSRWYDKVYKKGNNHPAIIKSPSNQSALQAAVDLNILKADPEGKYYFTHSSLAGFLAAQGIATAHREIIRRVLESPDWGPLHECMRYLPAYNDFKSFLKPFLTDKSLLKHKLLRAAQWLEYANENSPEETALLKQVTREIHTNPYYLIKIRLTCALVKSNSPQAKSILQHLAKSKDLETRRAAAVGLGLLQDLSAVPLLINQLNDYHPSSTAACYALGKISSPRSLEAIAEALLHGSELLRRAAAECLAHNRSEGHAALREGATREDLLVRYAVVHGLGLIDESWSLEILDEMRIDEKEWVVRDLAQQTHEILKSGSPYIPQDTPPPHQAFWLTEFTAVQDLPQPTPENALDLLLKALELGTYEQKQNALGHILRTGKEELIPAILELADYEAFEMAHQAMLVIWYCARQRYKVLHEAGDLKTKSS
mgnify:CR=1 FL=1